MGKLTRKEILRELHERTGLSQRMLSQIVETLLEEMKKAFDLSEEIKISGFGTFIPVYTRPRQGRNLKTVKELLYLLLKRCSFTSLQL